MAKLTMTFEDAKIKKVLEFRGKTYEYTMKPSMYGMRSDKPTIYAQLFEMADDDDDFLDSLENIDFGDEDDIIAAINYLTEIE